MDNNFLKCVDGVLKGDEQCINILDGVQLCTAGKTQMKYIENIVQELIHKMDVQQRTIKKLTSEMGKLEGRYKISALELLDMREKCNYLEHRILLLEDNTSRDSTTIKCDPLQHVPEATNEESEIQQRTIVTNMPTVLGNGAEYISAPRTCPTLHEDNYPVKNGITENCGANVREDLGLKSNPVNALHELCMNRNWETPKYESVENWRSKTFTYSTTCTLMSHTVQAGGISKKESKRTAATLMYHMILNITCAGDHQSPLEYQVPTLVPENRQGNTLLLDDVACTSFATGGLDDETLIVAVVDEPAIAESVDESVIIPVVDEPAVAEIVDEPVGRLTLSDANSELNDKQQVPTIDESSSHPTLLAEHDNVTTLLLPANVESVDHDDVNDTLAVNESIVKEDDRPSLLPEIAQFAARLRLSNNPSVRELKELNYINVITVSSCIDLVDRIVEEEGLTLEYDLISSITPNGNELISVQLTINSGALTFEGYGDVVYDCQEDSAYKCLSRFKTMLQD